MARTLYSEIRDYLDAHPYEGDPVEAGPGPLFHLDCDTGKVSLIGPAPDILAVSVELLDCADPEKMTFTEGVLTIDVAPDPVHYQVLYKSYYSLAVLFRHVLPPGRL